MTDLRLVIFDVDGTLVDSQADILAAMAAAFASEGLTLPSKVAVLSIVGLSLPVALARLLPEADSPTLARLVDAYKAAYADLRVSRGAAESSPLYPGARSALETLVADPTVRLAVATGKSRRGLDKLIEAHRLEGIFVSRQTADDHPSKPHPAMIHACLSEAGTLAEHAVMVGDTTYDMDMARAAGVGTVGVSWGYHPPSTLRADCVIDSFAALVPALDQRWSRVT